MQRPKDETGGLAVDGVLRITGHAACVDGCATVGLDLSDERQRGRLSFVAMLPAERSIFHFDEEMKEVALGTGGTGGSPWAIDRDGPESVEAR